MNYRNVLYVKGHPDFAQVAQVPSDEADRYIAKIRGCIKPGDTFQVKVYYNKTNVSLLITHGPAWHKPSWHKTLLEHSFETGTPLPDVLNWAHLALLFGC